MSGASGLSEDGAKSLYRSLIGGKYLDMSGAMGSRRIYIFLIGGKCLDMSGASGKYPGMSGASGLSEVEARYLIRG